MVRILIFIYLWEFGKNWKFIGWGWCVDVCAGIRSQYSRWLTCDKFHTYRIIQLDLSRYPPDKITWISCIDHLDKITWNAGNQFINLFYLYIQVSR